ncbi:oxygen-dependent coproporphyrinogen-III oxidase isoform X1 [Hydra vulgaris]|uniref:coproporphyrinogen oxidase n=1 Tax=Hydra vulgaris TaxID=6087 RepID=T2MFL6_HYDVU|nr:oxygen-dependent coproporphyrinogen-III oxidase [Hydra vulgaris]
MDDMNEFLDKIQMFTLNDFTAETISPLEKLKEENNMKSKMELYVTNLQSIIVNKLQSFEPTKKFKVDRWKREQGGGGITIVLQDGIVFEKAAVNISVVWGDMHEDQIKSMKSKGRDLKVEGKNRFFATGISSVIHPCNPFIPSLHFNYRYFEVVNENGHHTWWFGGGMDLTPNYLNEKDASHFHKTLKMACDKHNSLYYPKFKKWADDYFFNKHRGEARGVGGTFFDDFDEGSIDDCFAFVVSCGNSVLPSYVPLIEEHKDKPFSSRHRDWQLMRRGRYVEFNLVYDRGTQFGLATPGARIESILVSMPLIAKWEYCPELEHGDEEAKLIKVLKEPKEWI